MYYLSADADSQIVLHVGVSTHPPHPCDADRTINPRKHSLDAAATWPRTLGSPRPQVKPVQLFLTPGEKLHSKWHTSPNVGSGSPRCNHGQEFPRRTKGVVEEAEESLEEIHPPEQGSKLSYCPLPLFSLLWRPWVTAPITAKGTQAQPHQCDTDTRYIHEALMRDYDHS